MMEKFSDYKMGGEDQKRGAHRPEDENKSGIAFRNFKDKEIEEQETDNRSPCFQDYNEFEIEFPAPPRAVELKILKADKAGRKNNQFQPSIITAPRNLIGKQQQP